MLTAHYLKSALVGALTACIAIVITVAVMVRINYSEGSGAVFVSVSSWQILAAAAVGFAAGCWWMLRRTRRRHT